MVDRPGKARRGLSRPERLQGNGAGVGVREPSQADLGAPWMLLGRLWQQPVRGNSAWLGIPGVSGTSAWRVRPASGCGMPSPASHLVGLKGVRTRRVGGKVWLPPTPGRSTPAQS